MNVEEMKRALGMNSVPECFVEFYENIKDTYESRANLIFSEKYISDILEDSRALIPYKETVLLAAEKVYENAAMRLLVCLLEMWIKNGGDPRDAVYDAPAGEGVQYDFLHLFPAIPTIPDSLKYLRNRGLPEDVITATMQEYDYCLNFCLKNSGRLAFDRGRLGWMRHLINNNLIRVGRFKYELPAKRIKGIRVYKNKLDEIIILADSVRVHRDGVILGSYGVKDENDSFYAEIVEEDGKIIGHAVSDGKILREKTILIKEEWKLMLSEEDNVIPVHIPPCESFDCDIVEASYERMREIMRVHYPEMPYKAFHCDSWLTSNDLNKVLKPTSNILAFQNKYIKYPRKNGGAIGIFNFVFPGQGGIGNLKNLSEESSLQRNIKELYLKGGYIKEHSGFFF